MAHKVKDFNLDGTYVERDATAEEVSYLDSKLANRLTDALDALRIQRNILLAKTDWTSSSDLTMSTEMKEYRQKLRDAPSGLDTVEKVQAYTFPTEVTK
tara:strand:- start:44 stop:340 length:297 start_codon:yes stop_codon:yes gene_type:complete